MFRFPLCVHPGAQTVYLQLLIWTTQIFMPFVATGLAASGDFGCLGRLRATCVCVCCVLISRVEDFHFILFAQPRLC